MRSYCNSLLAPTGTELNQVLPIPSSKRAFLLETKPLETVQINENPYEGEGQDQKNPNTVAYNNFATNTKFNETTSQTQGEMKPLNFSQMAKKIGSFTKNAMVNQEKEYHDEYLQNLDTASKLFKCSSSDSPIFRVFNHMIFFILQISIFLFNLLSLLDVIWVAEYRLGVEVAWSYDCLLKMELAVAVFFICEVILNILGCEGSALRKLAEILAFKNIMNILLIMEIITTTMYSNNFIRISDFFIMVWILRSLKLIKLRMIISLMWKKLQELISKNDGLLADSWNSQNELKYFVYNSALDIIIAIFIEATAFMAVDEALEYQAFEGNVKKFDYIAASYYSIVTLMTIGYGDIYPIEWQSRIFVVVVMFFNLSVLSSFLSTFTDKIYQISPFIRNFNFKNHIVIVGELPITFLKCFIKEMHLCDSIISTNLMNQNLNEKIQLSQIILVGKETPPKDLQRWLEDFTERYVEIRYLKSNIFDNAWQKQTNLEAARHIFAFSINFEESPEQASETDKAMFYNMQKVMNSNPNLEITLVLSNDFGDQFNDQPSSVSSINIVSTQILNEYFMANSLENQGLNTFLTHLVTLREKIMPKGTEMSQLEEYSLNMGQELYPISKFSLNFFKMSRFVRLADFLRGENLSRNHENVLFL